MSLAIATRGKDVPRWFAEGVGASLAQNKITDRMAKQKLQAETVEAVGACKDAKAFLGNKLTPVQSDRIGAALVSKMMDRDNRRKFDACLRSLGQGMPFESAFAQAFRAPVNTWINSWLAWARG